MGREKKREVMVVLLGLILMGGACQKKGDFINEDKLGTGIHYYPVILNQDYYDTITHKYFDDTLFSTGQKIIFELKYTSQDTIEQLELWTQEPGREQQKIWSIPYKASYYSAVQKCDTTFINCTLPSLSDSSQRELTLFPKVITQKGLSETGTFTIRLK